MNNHQTYRTWILQDTPLNEDDERILRAHLASCEECQQLQTGWKEAHRQMMTASMVAPAPGFSRRWKASLAERRALQHQAQTRRFLIILFSITLLSFLGLVITFVLGTSPVSMIATMLSSSVNLLLFARRAGNVFNNVFHSVPLFVPVIIWILSSTGFSLAALVWGASIWKFVIKGVNVK